MDRILINVPLAIFLTLLGGCGATLKQGPAYPPRGEAAAACVVAAGVLFVAAGAALVVEQPEEPEKQFDRAAVAGGLAGLGAAFAGLAVLLQAHEEE